MPGENFKHSCPLYLDIGVTKENTVTQSSTRWNSALIYRKRERSVSLVCPRSLRTSKLSLTQVDKGNGSYLPFSFLPPSALERNDPNPTPVESEILKAGVCLEVIATCLSRAKAPTKPEIRKEIPLWSDKPHRGHVGSLSLGMKYPRPRALLIPTDGGPKTSFLRLPFPTVFILLPNGSQANMTRQFASNTYHNIQWTFLLVHACWIQFIISNNWKNSTPCECPVSTLCEVLVSDIFILMSIQVFFSFHHCQQCCCKYLIPVFLGLPLFRKIDSQKWRAGSEGLSISCHSPGSELQEEDLFLTTLAAQAVLPRWRFC